MTTPQAASNTTHPSRRTKLDDRTNEHTRVKMWRCQVFLALVQTSFVLGAVYFKYSLNHEDHVHRTNPIVFAFIREAIAGTVMCVLAYVTTKAVPRKEDLSHLFFLGILVYCNQLFYIMGVKMSGVVVATCVQPAIPVFTAALAVTLGREQPSVSKTVGIVFASASAICMVAGGGLQQPTGSASSPDMALGNLLLLLNTFAMAMYYVHAKPLLSQYSPMSLAAWAYVTAACAMGVTAVWYNQRYQHSWTLPEDAYGPLIYWILICSVCGYYVIALAMKHLPSTQVAAFQCLQPPIGSLLGFAVLGEALSIWDLGALGVICGLYLVNRESGKHSKDKALPLPKIEVRKVLS